MVAIPICQSVSNVLTPQWLHGFLTYLRAQLLEEHRRKGMMRDVALPDYIWVKEQDDEVIILIIISSRLFK